MTLGGYFPQKKGFSFISNWLKEGFVSFLVPSPVVLPTKPETVGSQKSGYSLSDDDCVLIETKACLGECESCQMLDFSSDLFDAYNKKWREQHRQPGRPCDECDIFRTNKENYQAKCIKGSCRKVKK